MKNDMESLIEENKELKRQLHYASVANKIIAELVAIIPLDQVTIAGVNGGTLIAYYKDLHKRANERESNEN